YRTGVPGLIEAASPDMKSKFQAEWAKIIPALEDYQSYLQSQLLPKSTGNFRLGDQAHSRLLTLTGEFSIPGAELTARAKADYNNIRNAMGLVCLPYYKIMYPNINADQLAAQIGADQALNTVIQGVLDKLKTDHPAKEGFFEESKKTAEAVKSFISEKKLVDLPPVDIDIVPMPAGERGLSMTALVGPGPYETGGAYRMQVAPLPDEWTPEQGTSFLEEYNRFYFPFWTVQNIYPGSFVPLFYTDRSGSLMRRLYPNRPLINGWPVCLEDMLVYEGYGNYGLRFRLNQLKSQLKMVIDFQLELNIHQGGMTKEQAIPYMTRGGFQTQAEAEWKWNRILLAPCESAYPYIGYQEILDMEKDYRKTKGDAFSKKEFLQELLNHGAMPIRFLKAKLAAQ
ncbi:MAG: DUF885 family protein, partial [Candidatus Aminicenantales bacterium]